MKLHENPFARKLRALCNACHHAHPLLHAACSAAYAAGGAEVVDKAAVSFALAALYLVLALPAVER